MKAKRGGDINESRLKALFSDDPAMQAFLNVDCQKKFLIDTLNKLEKEALTRIQGGMAKGTKRGREEESDSEDDLERRLQQLPVASPQPELVGPMTNRHCSPVQRIIAILISICIELGAVFIGKQIVSLCFKQEQDAISSIVRAVIDAISKDTDPAVFKTFLAGFLGAFYVKKKGVDYTTILQQLLDNFKRLPIVNNRYEAIMKRADNLCNSGFIPVGRSLTLELLKIRVMNALKSMGLGRQAEEESRRDVDILRKQIEIAEELQKKQAEEKFRQKEEELARMRRGEIPILPLIGEASGLFRKSKKSKAVSLKKQIEKVGSTMRERGRKKLKEELDELQSDLDGINEEEIVLEDVLENRVARIEEARKELSKETDPIKESLLMDTIKRLDKGESEFIDRLQELRRMKPNLEKRMMTIREVLFQPLEYSPSSSSSSSLSSRSPSRSRSPSPQQKRKSKKQRTDGGGKRRTNKKYHSSKTHKKQNGKRHHRKSRRL